MLGWRSTAGARTASHAAALLSVLLGGAVMAGMISTRNVRRTSVRGRSEQLQVFGYLFTDDPDTVALVGKVLPLVASFQVRDSIT